MNRAVLRQLSSWMGFVGIITIISGIISVISGLFTFIIGAIPGIIAIVMGVKLRAAKQYTDAIILDHSGSSFTLNFNMLVANLNTYFKIQGILIITCLVLGFIVIILGALLGYALLSGGFF